MEKHDRKNQTEKLGLLRSKGSVSSPDKKLRAPGNSGAQKALDEEGGEPGTARRLPPGQGAETAQGRLGSRQGLLRPHWVPS